MKRLRVTLLVLLAGCAGAGALRDYGEKYQHASRLSPRDAAECLGRAAEQHRGDWRAQWRAGPVPGTYEVLVGTGEYVFVADVVPSSTGSNIAMYGGRQVPRFVRDRGAAAIFKAC